MMLEILALSNAVLVVALVVNDARHRKTEMALLDRALLASGQQPITPPVPVEPAFVKPEFPKKKLLFRVR